MSISIKRGRAHRALRLSVAVVGFAVFPLVSNAAGLGDQIDVIVDQAKLIKLPERVATLVVGNPMIADVTLQAGGMMVVTGKGYGATNFIALDREGTVLLDRVIQVEGPTDNLVTVYRGVDRETYSCTPICQRRVTLGDGQGYFSNTLEQAGTLSSQAAGNATTAAANSGSAGGAAAPR